ncbi:MAG TPA: GMC oxidoreductase [Sporichthyaceae bacterium]|nr:GMC oxidoreductase [Sporichthyaceae bacterium]
MWGPLMQMNRRAFLAGTLAAAASTTAVLRAPRAAAAPGRIPLTRDSRRVVVIGSGFGGGVTALRLARAGVPVLVLERGIRWPTGPNAHTFPGITSLDERASWMNSGLFFDLPTPSRRFTGLLERVQGSGMAIMCAAGVGGGSLVYQGMSLQPSAEVFAATFPAGLDYAHLDRVYYPRVARMLGLATAPDELIRSAPYAAARLFARNARAAGYRVEKVPMPIDWSYALRELHGEMRPSYTNGDCALGVNNGGKHTVDVTYLARAEATGLVEVAPLHQVVDIARDGDAWTVRVERIDTGGVVQEVKLITARTLVLAAGSANTTRLLVRAAGRGQIDDLPDGLGSGWGSNGDQIYTWTDLTESFGAPQGGPVIYSSKDWSDPAKATTVIQASVPPLPGNDRTTMLVGYGVSSGRGVFRYDARQDEALLDFPGDADAGVAGRIHERLTRIAGPASLLLNTSTLDTTTWHPLGGACMGPVCDLDGRVHGQRGLYVLDGALMPGTTAACNPSMTIAAIAERALDNLVRHDVDSVI